MAHYAASATSATSPDRFSTSRGPSTSAPPPPSGPQASDSSSQQTAAPTQHKRVYQACIPCRRRKVRCDLGSVDNPNDPPCVRCRRESKECYFSATRRKRKIDDGAIDSVEEADHDDYIVRNGRKRLNTNTSSPVPTLDRRLYSDVPLTPGGGPGRSHPVTRPGDGRRERRSSTGAEVNGSRRGTNEFANVEPNQPLENFEARQVMRTQVYGPHDALSLLYKAATDKLVPSPSSIPAGLVFSSIELTMHVSCQPLKPPR